MASPVTQKSNSPLHDFYDRAVKITKKHPYKAAAFSASVLTGTGYLALNTSTVSRAFRSISKFFSASVQPSSGLGSYLTSTNVLIGEALLFVLLGLTIKLHESSKRA